MDNLPLNQIINDNCLNVLAGLPANIADLCFADPPFNLGKKYKSYKDHLSEADYYAWCELWLTELVRVSKGNIIIHNIPKHLIKIAVILEGLGCRLVEWVAWNAPSAKAFNRVLDPTHYGFLWFQKNDAPPKQFALRSPHQRCRSCKALSKNYGGQIHELHPFGPLLGSVWMDIKRSSHSSKLTQGHPCGLPVLIMERLILLTTDPGDLVIDPFMGTGATAIAAKSLNRNYIGSELEAEYSQIAQRRIFRESELKRVGDKFVSKKHGKIITLRDIDYPEINHLLGEYQHEEKQKTLW